MVYAANLRVYTSSRNIKASRNNMCLQITNAFVPSETNFVKKHSAMNIPLFVPHAAIDSSTYLKSGDAVCVGNHHVVSLSRIYVNQLEATSSGAWRNRIGSCFIEGHVPNNSVTARALPSPENTSVQLLNKTLSARPTTDTS